MYGHTYRVSIEPLEDGAYTVEVPDMEAIAKKKAEAKKKSKDGCCPEPYIGDCTKKYAAKSVKEVTKLVQAALEQLPEGEYDSSFDEAAKKK